MYTYTCNSYAKHDSELSICLYDQRDKQSVNANVFHFVINEYHRFNNKRNGGIEMERIYRRCMFTVKSIFFLPISHSMTFFFPCSSDIHQNTGRALPWVSSSWANISLSIVFLGNICAHRCMHIHTQQLCKHRISMSIWVRMRDCV